MPNTCPKCGTDYPSDTVICVKCGVDLRTGEALETEADPVRGPAILVGRNALTERLLADTDWTGLGEDGCEVRRVDSVLVLAGAAPRGTLYAVYEFLDRVLGCRWLAPGVSVLPGRPEIVIDQLQHRHVPPFRYREYYDYRGYADPDWQARNRLNGHFGKLDAAHGGHWRYLKDGFGHTWFLWVPPEIHFAGHPEFYSEVGGRRQYVAAQLCLTNERLPDVMADSIRRQLRVEPGARIVSITQMDWQGRCQCANCRRLEEREGAASGPIIHFVNRVAERLEPEFPQVRFDTFAYTWSIDPPRQVRPRPSVMIRLCHLTPCCNAHPVEQCEINRPFLKLLAAWSGIAPELFVWDYYTNFHLLLLLYSRKTSNVD